MNHTTLQQLLSAYVDGELTNEESVLVREHLQHCAECTRSLREIQLIRTDLRSVAHVELRSTFTPQLLRTLRQQQEQNGGWGTAELFARRLVFALIVVVFFVVGLGSFGGSEEAMVFEPYLSGESTDTVTARVLTTGEVSKEDLLLAVSTR
jgi:anti-sigma factor RsiW